MTADVTGVLRQTDLLCSVPAKDLQAVAAVSRLRAFRRGQVVFTRTDPGDTLVVVLSGRVKVVVRFCSSSRAKRPRTSARAAPALTSSVAATLRRLTEAASDLVFLDLPRRVAKVLLSQPRGEDGIIRPKISQEELAHQAGGTRQSVNAALRGFERRGWIEVHDRAVTVKQAAALGRFAGN